MSGESPRPTLEHMIGPDVAALRQFAGAYVAPRIAVLHRLGEERAAEYIHRIEDVFPEMMSYVVDALASSDESSERILACELLRTALVNPNPRTLSTLTALKSDPISEVSIAADRWMILAMETSPIPHLYRDLLIEMLPPSQEG